jgi:hypothetical protein
MTRDAIVDEVRAIRDEIASECGYDVHELFNSFRRLEVAGDPGRVSFVASNRRLGAPEQGSCKELLPASTALRR